MGTIETLRKSLDVSEHFVKKNLPTIITVASSGGMVGSVILMAREAPKAADKIKEKKLLDPGFSKMQVVAVYCEECWPSIALGTASIFGVNYANHKQLGRLASLGAAYSFVISESKNKDKIIETKDRVIDSLKGIVGEEKVEETKEKYGLSKTAYQTEKEDILPDPKVLGKNEIRPCRLAFTGQKFKNSMNGLTAGLEKCKESINNEFGIYDHKVDKVQYMPLAEVQYQIKCDMSDAGDLLGWCANSREKFDYKISVADIDGTVGYEVLLFPDPDYGYDVES